MESTNQRIRNRIVYTVTYIQCVQVKLETFPKTWHEGRSGFGSWRLHAPKVYFRLVGWSLIEVERCQSLLCIMLSKRALRPFHGLGMEVEGVAGDVWQSKAVL